MTTPLFQTSFLADTLDMTCSNDPVSVTTSAGVTIKRWERGVIEVLPSSARATDKHVLVSAGVHGNETAPLEMMDHWVNDIVAGKLDVGCHCLFIIAHPQAINRHTRFIETNLNRLFDAHNDEATLESTIAQRLKHYTDTFFLNTPRESRWHFDLHCSIRDSKHVSFAVSPRSRHETRHADLMRFLSVAHIEALILSNAPSSTYSWYSAEHHAAQALTIELGKVNRLGENNLARFEAFMNAMSDVIAGQDNESTRSTASPVVYRVTRTLMRLSEDFNFLFQDDVPNFTSFVHGEVFGHDGEKPLMAQNEHEAIVFPNPKVAIGQRAALMVCKVTVRYERGQIICD